MNFRDRVMWISCSERVLCGERSQSTTGAYVNSWSSS